MKNNKITTSQFYFSSFLSTLASLLFIDVSSSYQQILYIVFASVINLIVILFYRGNNNKLLHLILSVYFFITSLTVINKLVIFMHSAIKSGPYWVLILIITVTIFFCSAKGAEAFTRSAVIITFFVSLFLLYILASSVSGIQFQPLEFNTTSSIQPVLILLFPSAVYVSLNHMFSDRKKYPLFIYTVGTILTISYLIFISSPINHTFPLHHLTQKMHLGIFKGADFLLLAIFTIAIIFFVGTSIQCVVKNSSKLIAHGTYLFFIGVLSLITLYTQEVKGIILSANIQTVLTILMLITVIINSLVTRREKHHKICNKSKKS